MMVKTKIFKYYNNSFNKYGEKYFVMTKSIASVIDWKNGLLLCKDLAVS
jgi:hypothetical protein